MPPSAPTSSPASQANLNPIMQPLSPSSRSVPSPISTSSPIPPAPARKPPRSPIKCRRKSSNAAPANSAPFPNPSPPPSAVPKLAALSASSPSTATKTLSPIPPEPNTLPPSHQTISASKSQEFLPQISGLILITWNPPRLNVPFGIPTSCKKQSLHNERRRSLRRSSSGLHRRLGETRRPLRR